MFLQDIKTKIGCIAMKAIQDAVGSVPGTILLQQPPKLDLGDFAFPCFTLGKEYNIAPYTLAQRIAGNVISNGTKITATAEGGYVNFRISPETLFSSVCTEILTQGSLYGMNAVGTGERVMVEYVSPNTNKPLHLGHIRNGVLGAALAAILKAAGYTVITSNLVNDRGIHICKSMLAWKKWGNGETPESTGMKGDLFVGKWYVRYAQELETNKSIETEVQTMLQQWEAEDPEVRALWRMMNKWVYDGFAETYARLGISFDQFYYESETYMLGKDIIQAGTAQGIFYQEPSGTIVFDLPVEQFGTEKNGKLKKTVLLRKDGTSVYMTQDIGTAVLKAQEHGLTRSIYVVGSEQIHHFKSLFTILNALGYTWASNCFHLSYGMVYLPEGKMKSREGKTVEADDLITGMEERAYDAIMARHQGNPLTDHEIAQRAHHIGLGAIKFYLLGVQPSQDIHFNPTSSLSFDGCTGPYCQYAFARASSIIEQAGSSTLPSLEDVDFSVLGTIEERLLVQQLMTFPENIAIAASQLNPLRVVLGLYETAKAFSQFYNTTPVLNGTSPAVKNARLALVKAAAQVLQNSMNLIGIKALQQM
ncbi:MAG: arginine--tRNA ligase [bacterium]